MEDLQHTLLKQGANMQAFDVQRVNLKHNIQTNELTRKIDSPNPLEQIDWGENVLEIWIQHSNLKMWVRRENIIRALITWRLSS